MHRKTLLKIKDYCFFFFCWKFTI